MSDLEIAMIAVGDFECACSGNDTCDGHIRYQKILSRLFELQDKLEKAKAFIKAECYCEMDGEIPKHCKNCKFLEGI